MPKLRQGTKYSKNTMIYAAKLNTKMEKAEKSIEFPSACKKVFLIQNGSRGAEKQVVAVIPKLLHRAGIRSVYEYFA